MTTTKAKIGDGKCQWNFGGWFGGLCGATMFLLVGGAAFVFQHPLLSAIWLSCFVATVSFGVILWIRRASITPYPAVQLLLLTCGISGAVAVVSAILMAPKLLAAVQLTPVTSLLLLMMYPGLMLQMHLVETGARQKGLPKKLRKTEKLSEGSSIPSRSD